MGWGRREHRLGLEAGRDLFRHVVTDGALDPLPAVPVALRRGEQAYADLPFLYSRFYGTNVSYRRRRITAFGSGAFVLVGLVANALGNAAARRSALARAAPQWRERQVARTVLTSERLLVGTRTAWLSFWHGGMDEFLPEPERFTLVTTYPDCEPVMLQGPGVPWLSVAMARLLWTPEEIRYRPEFAELAAWYAAVGEDR